MKVLIIHHLEMIWQQGYLRQGTSFEELARKTRQHIRSNPYDLIILTRFEDHRLGDEHDESGLSKYIDEVQIYGYGWEEEMLKHFPEDQKWVHGGSHSEIVLVEPWMEKLKQDEVYLCGAFDGECIEDMELALSGADIEFKRIESLIV